MASTSSFLACSAFVRPNNLRFSTLLQTLAVARHISRASGGCVAGLSTVREPEMQRLLNYMTVTMITPRHMQALRRSNEALTVHLPRRITRDRASLLHDERGRNRGIGLREVAPLIGLDLDATMPAAPVQRSFTADDRSSEGDSLILADIYQEPSEKKYAVDLKIEPRGHREWGIIWLKVWQQQE